MLSRLTWHARERVVLPPAVLADILSSAAEHWPLETGGVLLGTGTSEPAVVRQLIGAGPQAARERRAFTPDHDWQARAVADAWQRDRGLEYMGDWHSHPNGSAVLSKQDRDALDVIARSPDARQPRPLMLVVALGRDGSVAVGGARAGNRGLRALAVEIGDR